MMVLRDYPIDGHVIRLMKHGSTNMNFDDMMKAQSVQYAKMMK